MILTYVSPVSHPMLLSPGSFILQILLHEPSQTNVSPIKQKIN